MEIDDATELVIREALWRLGPVARMDPAPVCRCSSAFWQLLRNVSIQGRSLGDG
jgi:hypothetical protein